MKKEIIDIGIHKKLNFFNQLAIIAYKFIYETISYHSFFFTLFFGSLLHKRVWIGK